MTRTHRLELDDQTLREWDAVVLDAGPDGIVLDQSAFYPGGGGQPPDHGVLLWGGVQTRIAGVRKGDDLYLLPVEGDPLPEAGTPVRGAVEDERRTALMRTHSGLHILCGVVFRDYGALVTGGNMEPSMSLQRRTLRGMDDDRNLTCDIYCRLSLAVMGDTTKVDDQERICREIAARRGWSVGRVWKDNSRSAWRRDRKRPGWDAMLGRVRDSQIGAVIAYHGDRMIRQPYDLEVLLNLADRQGIRFASVMGDRDLDNADDRYILRIEAAQACRESDNTSRRLKAHHERRRRAGLTRPGGRGGRAAGFATDGVTHIETEVKFIREAAERIIAGEPTGAVAADLSARGWVTPAGGPVSHGTLKKMLLRPRYAGLMPDGSTPAAWEPVLDREIWEQCRAVLTGRAAGFGYATNTARHLLSGIAACGTCGSPVQIRQSKGRRGKQPQEGYGCVNPDCGRKVFRSSAHLDGHVTGIVLGLLADRRFLAALSAPGSGTAAREILVLEQRRDEMRAQLADLAGHPELSPAAAVAALESFTARITQLRDGMAVTARARLLAAHAGLTLAGWDALPLGTRRALTAEAVTIVILPATRRGPGFDPESVTVAPR